MCSFYLISIAIQLARIIDGRAPRVLSPRLLWPASSLYHLTLAPVPFMLLLRRIRFFLFSVWAIQILIFCMASEHLVVSLFVVYGFPFLVPFPQLISVSFSFPIQAEQGVPVHISRFFGLYSSPFSWLSASTLGFVCA